MLQKLPIDVTGRVAAVRAGIGAPRKGKPVQTPPFTHDPSATGAFDSLSEIEAPSVDGRAPKAVVIGGGTGAPMSIRTLLSMGAETSAVVAMADDGGSTGILRDEAGVTAPGDVRKCITAMAADPHDPLTAAFKLRFSFAENHTLGNLMLSSLEVTSRSFPEAIKICERILNARGHVYPSTLNRVNLVAKTRDGHVLEGQAVACHSRSALETVNLRSTEPIIAYEPALQAIRQADLIVLGPGSLYTSIIPNLLVPGIVDAIRESKGKTLFVCSLADMQGETWGLNAYEHFEALEKHGLSGLLDFMLVHKPAASGPNMRESMTYGVDNDTMRARPVIASDEVVAAIESHGTRVIQRDLVDGMRPTWHDPRKMQAAFVEVLKLCHSPRM